MLAKYVKNPKNFDYYRTCEKPYPMTINWKVIAGKDDLHVLQRYDVLFDDYDCKIRQLTAPVPKKEPKLPIPEKKVENKDVTSKSSQS